MDLAKRYKHYLEEREALSVIETEHGFATYRLEANHCYIRDIYVEPAYRTEGAASHMADQISEVARSEGCKLLYGSVDPTAQGAHRSLLVLLGYGFTLSHTQGPLIFFVKEL